VIEMTRYPRPTRDESHLGVAKIGWTSGFSRKIPLKRGVRSSPTTHLSVAKNCGNFHG